ncbi:MAG: hypothetical protein Q9208_006268 [Pyrenodesmia sp. 3 TL-2023]
MASQLRAQWVNPTDILSVLMIIGGDVVQRALAQLSGGYLTPVAFSFGWVGYSVSALLSAVGDNKLMPLSPDCQSIVINTKTGYVRTNQSWILGRILRDYECWMSASIKNELKAKVGKTRSHKAGLCVSFFDAVEAKDGKKAGEPTFDIVWMSGFIVALIQLGIATVPCGLYRQYIILLVTACGIVLAFASGALPQWKEEKLACRSGSRKVVALTKGNGAQHVIVINGRGVGLDLEDLAAADGVTLMSTRYYAFGLALLWLALLITVAGIRENTWYMLAVGSIGMVQNVFVAGKSRKPSAFGLHLEFSKAIVKEKVMMTLMATEIAYPTIGRALISTFFPGNLTKQEEEWWAQPDAEKSATLLDNED